MKQLENPMARPLAIDEEIKLGYHDDNFITCEYCGEDVCLDLSKNRMHKKCFEMEKAEILRQRKKDKDTQKHSIEIEEEE